MIKALARLLERCNETQRTRWFRIFASAAALVLLALTVTLMRTASWAAPQPGGFPWYLFIYNAWAGPATVAGLMLVIIWLQLGLTGLGLGVLSVGGWALLRLLGAGDWSMVVLGAGTMTLVFLALAQAMRRLFDLPWRPLAVGKLVLEEALRTKLALGFIAAIILFIPLLAVRLDPGELLHYRIQTFLSYGVGVSYAVLTLMTLFVAAASVAFEQRDKQIFGVVTKPITRFEYLIGKWLGVMGLTFVLLAVSGGSVFWFTEYLSGLAPKNEADRLATTEQVMTARVGVRPTLPDFQEEALEWAREEYRVRSELGENPGTLQNLIRERIKAIQAAELTLDPGQARDFRFDNVHPISRTRRVTVSLSEPIELGDALKTVYDLVMESDDGSIIYTPGGHYAYESTDPAVIRILPLEQQRARLGADAALLQDGNRVVIHYFPSNALTLRFKLDSGLNEPGDIFPMTFGVESLSYWEVQQVALVQFQTMLIPAGAIGQNGSVDITILNGDIEQGIMHGESVSFPPDGLELMYKVGRFEGNFLRALLLLWIKLSFLAMLAIAAATFASFPVACLMAFTIFFCAEMGPFLGEALEYYETTDAVTKEVHYVRIVIAAIATAAQFVLSSFGEIRPTQNLIDGRYVSWAAVGQAFVLIFCVWTGLTALVGWVAFRSRQVAIYSGHQ